MPWDPKVYNQFRNLRYRPFFDLVDLVSGDTMKNAVDIGCGTGEQTAILAERFTKCNFLGIDSSVEMLAGSEKLKKDNLRFELMTTESFSLSRSTFDLIFSNAALQWSDDHKRLFPQLIAKLNPGGQLAIQMPFQKENALNQLLSELVKEAPFAGWLNDYHRDSPVLTMDEYADLLFANGLKDITIFLKVYPLIAQNETELYNFISGSALIPYMERLTEEQQAVFSTEYMKRIKIRFPHYPAIYSFKRILMHATS